MVYGIHHVHLAQQRNRIMTIDDVSESIHLQIYELSVLTTKHGKAR